MHAPLIVGLVSVAGLSGLGSGVVEPRQAKPNAKPNAALAFDGVDDVATVQPHADLRYPGYGGWTVEFWIKPGAFDHDASEAGVLVQESVGVAGQDPWGFRQHSSSFSFRVDGQDSKSGSHTLHFDLRAGAWQHVAGVYRWDPREEVGHIAVYVDGRRVIESPTHVRMGTRFDPIRMGHIGREFGLPAFRGLLDEVRVWAGELDGSQIEGVRAGDLGAVDARPLAWWPLDETSGIVGADASGNGHHLVLGNAVWGGDGATRAVWTGVKVSVRAEASSPLDPRQ
ncbi:MAG: LamG domain-containing protein [Planctomycetota bacterium]